MNARLQNRTTFFARFATALYAVAICVLSLIPGRNVPMEGINDKYRHAAAYAGFAVLVGMSVFHLRWRAIPTAFVIATLVGIAMEIVQPYFQRSRDLYDALANSLGAFAGCLIVGFAIFLRYRQGRLTGRAENT